MRVALTLLSVVRLGSESTLTQSDLLLVAGEEREMTPPVRVARVELDDAAIAEATIQDGKTVIVIARRPGGATLRLLGAAGEVVAEYRLRVFESQAQLLRHDVSGLLQGVSGVEVAVESERVVLRGSARNLDDLKRVRDISREFPELLDLVSLESPEPTARRHEPLSPSKADTASSIRLGEISVRVPRVNGWSLVESENGFHEEHAETGARIEGRVARVVRGMQFKDAEAALPAGRAEFFLERRALRLKEHEASLSTWVDPEGRLVYRLTATGTPFPVNLDYAIVEGVFPPAGVAPGEAALSDILEGLGAPRVDTELGVPYPHRRAGFLVRYPAGWTVGGETAEGAGFYQNPDNRPVINITVERLPGTYDGEAGLARAAALLFNRARSRGAFRVESEGGSPGEPWARLIAFGDARTLRQKQVVRLEDHQAFAMVLTAEPELFPTYETALRTLVKSFRVLELRAQ